MSDKDKNAAEEAAEGKSKTNFIEAIINEEIKEGKHEGRVHTRFPPEPNGYLHIGHAKAICLSFGIAQKYQGKCNLRFDDTNPSKEETEYVESIKEDVKWLGFQWDEEHFTSDYFDQLYEWAEKMILDGKAYVDDQSAEEIAAQKGTPTKAGIESPYRNRTPEENLQMFRDMKAGKYREGEKVLRAKIDMAAANMHLRDPLMYRIMHKEHHRTGDKWCIYPMYDYAHGQSDYIEKITNSLCTLEFEVHRPLYDWFLDQLVEDEHYRPRQTEFARLNLSYTVMSKRKLLQLVKENYVNGWDDPRMPTVSGMRRRGYTPASLRNFADTIGIAKRDNVIDVALLEHAVREDLNKVAPRVFGVLDPVKVVITNYPEGQTEEMDLINNPEDESQGSRKVPFSREVFIERNDFMVDPPRKFFRMGPGREVRLKGAYIVKCEDYKMNAETGEIEEIYCTYDPDTKSGMSRANRKVKGTLHWVSCAHALDAEIRIYDRLFMDEAPDGHEGKDFKEFLNPDSLQKTTAKVEPALAKAKALDHFQFQRIGYFNIDPDTEKEGRLIFNRTVPLRDSWSKKGK